MHLIASLVKDLLELQVSLLPFHQLSSAERAELQLLGSLQCLDKAIQRGWYMFLRETRLHRGGRHAPASSTIARASRRTV